MTERELQVVEEHWDCPVCLEGYPYRPSVAERAEGPVHVVDAGRYRAVCRGDRLMIERADTAGAVLGVEGEGV
jgi:hypothetical protein